MSSLQCVSKPQSHREHTGRLCVTVTARYERRWFGTAKRIFRVATGRIPGSAASQPSSMCRNAILYFIRRSSCSENSPYGRIAEVVPRRRAMEARARQSPVARVRRVGLFGGGHAEITERSNWFTDSEEWNTWAHRDRERPQPRPRPFEQRTGWAWPCCNRTGTPRRVHHQIVASSPRAVSWFFPGPGAVCLSIHFTSLLLPVSPGGGPTWVGQPGQQQPRVSAMLRSRLPP